MSQEKLLIIEDEINLQNALKYYFEHENYIVDTAQDGELGLSKATKDRVDTVFQTLKDKEDEALNLA